MFNNNLTHHPPPKKIVGVKWFYFLNDFSISLKTCKPWFAVMLIPGIHNEHTLSYSLSKLKTFLWFVNKKINYPSVSASSCEQNSKQHKQDNMGRFDVFFISKNKEQIQVHLFNSG